MRSARLKSPGPFFLTQTTFSHTHKNRYNRFTLSVKRAESKAVKFSLKRLNVGCRHPSEVKSHSGRNWCRSVNSIETWRCLTKASVKFLSKEKERTTITTTTDSETKTTKTSGRYQQKTSLSSLNQSFLLLLMKWISTAVATMSEKKAPTGDGARARLWNHPWHESVLIVKIIVSSSSLRWIENLVPRWSLGMRKRTNVWQRDRSWKNSSEENINKKFKLYQERMLVNEWKSFSRQNCPNRTLIWFRS